MAYTGIKSYAKPHGSGQSNGGSIIQVINKGGTNNFDPNYVNINTLEAHNGNIDNLRVKSATIDNAQFKYIMSPNGIINKVQGDELDYAYGNIDELASSNINTTKLTVKDEANIKNLINEYLKTNEINTDYLTVNKSAHFFELVVDKIRSVQGTQMNTAANCVIDYVEAYDSNGNLVDRTADNFIESNVNFYRIYWRNTDDDGKTIGNEWKAFDQAICSTFNVKEGTTQNASNKYYWRLVNGTDNGEVRYINFKTGEVKNTKPTTFEIIFTNGFQYGDVTDTSNNYTNFTATSNNVNNPGEYDPGLLTWRPSSTLYGIQVLANQEDHRILAGGGFIFETDIPTKLNVGVYYDDGSYDYFQAQEYTTSYNIITAAKKNAEAFIICTAELDKWESCNWIDLSNTDYAGTSRPEAGDNLCQLGYRYVDAVDPDNKKRASAIIIAAYQTPDKDIVPPSYAQYQDIQDFNLSSNRGTYFDATGAYIKGNLVSGTVIEPGVNIPIVVDTWKIVADYSIITKDNENHITPSTITLALLHNNGTSSSIVTSLPEDKAIYVNGVLNSGGLTIPVTSFENLNITLTDTANEQIFDKIIIETFDINATNGTDGVDGTNAFNNVFTYDKTDVTVTVSGQTLSEITSGLRVNIDNLKMIHVENGAATDVNFFAKGYTLCLDVITFNKAYKKSFIANTSTTQLWTVTNGTSASINTSNILFDMYPMPKPPYYRDYFKLQESNNDYLPVQLVIYMLDENNVQCTDKLRIDINMQAGYINQMTEAGLYQAFFGSYTKDGQTVNGMSSITATMEGISTNVQSISETVNQHSEFIQESGKFQTSITKQVNDLNGNVTSMQSQITQLPDQIKAEVNNGLQSTGIDITNGTITLDAENTIIDGNLNIHNANEGLIIYDNETDKPAITIIGDELGTINTATGSPIVIGASGVINGTEFAFPLIDLGTYEASNMILISDLKIRESNVDSTIGTLTFNIDILKNNTSVLNDTGQFYYNESNKIWERTQSPIQYTVPSGGDGHYYLRISLEATNSQVNNTLTLYGNSNVYLTKLNKISKNGAVFKHANDKQLWIGEDQYRLQWGNSYIKLNDNGVQYKPLDDAVSAGSRPLNHACGDLGSMMKVKHVTENSNYYATLYEGLIIIDDLVTSPFTLYLPVPGNATGKYYFIKNLSNKNITLTCNSSLPYIIDTNASTTMQTKTIGSESIMICSDGYNWIILR